MTSDRRVLLAVEDDPAFQVLIRAALAEEPRLNVAGEAPTTIEEALETTRELQPGLIILDHNLWGEMIGMNEAPRFKEAAPGAKIILFTAYDVGAEARREPAIDVFLRKDDVERLLPTSRRLLGLG